MQLQTGLAHFLGLDIVLPSRLPGIRRTRNWRLRCSGDRKGWRRIQAPFTANHAHKEFRIDRLEVYLSQIKKTGCECSLSVLLRES